MTILEKVAELSATQVKLLKRINSTRMRKQSNLQVRSVLIQLACCNFDSLNILIDVARKQGWAANV